MLYYKQELDEMKYYLDSHLNKRFIQANSAPYLSLILFVKKLGRQIRFCVDYQKLNAIIRKDRYPIPLILFIVCTK